MFFEKLKEGDHVLQQQCIPYLLSQLHTTGGFCEQTTSDSVTFHSSICSPNLSPLSVFVAPVCSSCCVKQAVNQPDPYTTTQASTGFHSPRLSFCAGLLCSLPCFTSPPLGCWLLQGSHRSSSDIYRPEASWDSKYVCCCWTCVRMCQETGGLCCDSILDFQPLYFALSKATDTPEDRNNPVLLYNKMELGDLNANFTLELESQVKINALSVRICCFFFTFLPLSNVLFSFSVCAFGLVLKVFDWSYFTAKIMDTVNISVPDTEKVINYSPNYYRRLNLILARYTKRCVCMSLLCLCIIACL